MTPYGQNAAFDHRNVMASRPGALKRRRRVFVYAAAPSGLPPGRAAADCYPLFQRSIRALSAIGLHD